VCLCAFVKFCDWCSFVVLVARLWLFVVVLCGVCCESKYIYVRRSLLSRNFLDVML